MQDNIISISGNIVDDPKLRVTKSGISVANFRVASTPRRYDEATRSFVDSPTLFMNVSVWRKMAENVFASLHRGEPVVVTGRLCQRTYQVEETVRVAYEIAATSVGHDLSRGRTEFTKAWLPSPANTVSADEHGMPADDSDIWHETVPDEVPEGLELASEDRSSASDELTEGARPLVPVA